MEKLVSLANRVRDGDLSGDDGSSHAKDEIGILSRAFYDLITTFLEFRNEIHTISTAASSGDLNVRGDERKFKGDYAVIINGVNKTVDAMAVPLKEAMNLSKRYASGDFRARMRKDLELQGEFFAGAGDLC